ncbi:FliM/FliN family flagellar motor switch protein [Alteriqipengyuania sp. 357]
MSESRPDSGERRTAQHCAELLANRSETADIAGDFARFGTRLARALQPRFAKLFDTHKIETVLVETSQVPADTLAEALGKRMHHARFALGGKGLGVLASASVGSLIGEFDRLLGGDGDAPGEAQALPASADRFAREIEAELLGACIDASGRGDLAAAGRGSDLGEIVPGTASAPVLLATIAVHRPDLPELTIRIATCEATFLQFASESPVGQPERRTIAEAGLDTSAVSLVELRATATLVDMAIPLHRIAGLQVGAMLPVAIHRAIPLSIGDTIIAHGTVGVVDDCVALEIHHTALARDS